MKQTAVEWLENEFQEMCKDFGGLHTDFIERFKQAKEMESQAIERGYDLDELIKNDYIKHSVKDDKLSLDEQIQRSGGFNVGYKEGFQKALELMSNKKFSEEDIKNAIEYSIQAVLQAVPGLTSTQSILDNYSQSLQQTEWDVEVEIDEEKEFIFDPAMGITQGHYLDKPKLDADGYLILKRK